MTDIAGHKVICRFDPEDINAGLEVYALDGSYLGFGETQEKSPFFNLASARESAALDRRRKKLARASLDAERPLDVAQVAAEMSDLSSEDRPNSQSKVVELVQKARGPILNRALPRPDVDEEDVAREQALVLRFEREAKAEAVVSDVPDDEVGRFHRAKEIEARLNDERPVGSTEAQWLHGYQQTSEYRTHDRIAARFGMDAIG